MPFISPGYLSPLFVIQDFPEQLNARGMMLYNSRLQRDVFSLQLVLMTMCMNVNDLKISLQLETSLFCKDAHPV